MKRTPQSHCSMCYGPLELNRVGKNGYCKSCHTSYVRERRAKQKENKQ